MVLDAAAFADLGATDIAEGVRSGRFTAAEVTAAALDRIAALEPRVNAFTNVLVGEATAEARALDAADPRGAGRLAGVPIAVKAELDVAGQVTTHGGRGNTRPAPADCELVRRLRAEGAVIVGMTNMPEFGQFPFTESARFGTTLNPRAPGRTPGGSSGGSAAAVAAGMVPVAIGTDGGGSIRIPSACCGLVGLKASRGRVSPAPRRDAWESLGIAGPLTRTVADSALVHDVIGGNLPADRYRLDVPRSGLSGPAGSDPGRLTIGMTLRPTGPGIAVDPEVAAAIERFAETLCGLGHRVVGIAERLPSQIGPFLPQMYAGLRATAASVEHPDRLEARTRRSVARSRVVASDRQVRRALADGRRFTDAVDAVLQGVDLILTPTLACVPPPLGQLDAAGPGRATWRSMPMVVFTSMFNVTGHPAVSLPAGLSRGGVPIGAQLVAAHGRDDLVLALAGQVERRVGWPGEGKLP